MEYLNNLIAPELFVLVPVLYLIGMGIKKSKWLKDEFIPVILGVSGVLLASLYLQSISFAGITQGILCAGASVYVNQLIKQGGKL